jgi:cytochrome b561
MTETREKQFRAVRIMHRIMLAAVIIYAFLAEKLAKSASSLPLSMTLSFGIMAIVIALIALGYRMKTLSSAIVALRRNPQDTQALFRWRQAHILIMVLLLSVALFGFVLRFMGGSFWLALPFYSASALLLLLWAPREIVDTIEGSGSSSSGK